MSSTQELLELSPSKLDRIIELLASVGLTAETTDEFKLRLQDPEFYNEERQFEWNVREANMRFIVERSWATDRVTGLFVYSLSEFVTGAKPFSKELIAAVNRSLSVVFSEPDWITESADLPEVDVTHVDYGSQIAVVILQDGRKIGINLWELAGRTRRADNFTNWQYRDSGRI